MSSDDDLVSKLHSLSALLAAFNHRNKNQHRRSVWWQHFTLLRRCLRKLSSGITSGPAGPGPKAAGSRAHATLPPKVVQHIEWISAHVVPSTYIAFTQLAADNQHAALGLLLLAALADFHALISPFLPSPQPPPASIIASSQGQAKEPASKPALVTDTTPACDGPEPDLGVTISRSQFIPAAAAAAPSPLPSVEPAPPRKKKRPASTHPAPAEPAASGSVPKKKKKKRKPAGATDFSSLFDSL